MLAVNFKIKLIFLSRNIHLSTQLYHALIATFTPSFLLYPLVRCDYHSSNNYLFWYLRSFWRNPFQLNLTTDMEFAQNYGLDRHHCSVVVCCFLQKLSWKNCVQNGKKVLISAWYSKPQFFYFLVANRQRDWCHHLVIWIIEMFMHFSLWRTSFLLFLVWLKMVIFISGERLKSHFGHFLRFFAKNGQNERVWASYFNNWIINHSETY